MCVGQRFMFHVCMYIHTYRREYTFHACKRKHTYIYTYTYLQTMHTDIHVLTWRFTHASMYIYSYNKCTFHAYHYIRTHMYMDMHTPVGPRAKVQNIGIYTYIHIYIHTYHQAHVPKSSPYTYTY
jgi:hypothetical protein